MLRVELHSPARHPKRRFGQRFAFSDELLKRRGTIRFGVEFFVGLAVGDLPVEQTDFRLRDSDELT